MHREEPPDRKDDHRLQLREGEDPNVHTSRQAIGEDANRRLFRSERQERLEPKDLIACGS